MSKKSQMKAAFYLAKVNPRKYRIKYERMRLCWRLSLFEKQWRDEGLNRWVLVWVLSLDYGMIE
jgi:hypothetical protein